MDINEKLFKKSDWKGKNFFHFNMLCLSGPSNIKPFLMTGIFSIIPYIVHLYNSSRWFTEKVSSAIPIIGGIILIFVLFYMGMTTFIDAGVIPRNIMPSYYMVNEKRKKKLVNHNGYMKRISKCDSCFIIKPFRSSHCPDCDNCVLRFDHHCPWIGNCVAIRNYKYFYIFLFLLNIQSIYLMICSIFHVVTSTKDVLSKSNSFNTSIGMSHSLGSLFVIFYCFIKMLFITGLIGYHSYLVSNNITTKEELKNTFKGIQGNPYKRSVIKNVSLLFCKQRVWKKSYFDMVKWKNIRL